MTAAIPAPLLPRRARDAYWTPDALAVACVGVLPEMTPALLIEPSVGGGAFARAMRVRWPSAAVIGVDIDPAAPGFESCDHDYVDAWSPEVLADIIASHPIPAAIVGNPPYNQAEDHVRLAVSAAPVVGMLLRLGWLAGQRRRAFWREHPPAEVHVLSRRPSFTQGGTDASEYAFYVWDSGRSSAPVLCWLDW